MKLQKDKVYLHLYLPEPKEIKKIPKQWLANVCHTVLKDIFKTWVKAQVDKRNKEMAIKKDLLIECDPEIAAAFNASTKVSGKLNDESLTIKFYFNSTTWYGSSYA